MTQKIISWTEVRVNDLVRVGLNDGTVSQVTRREESDRRLFVSLKDMLSTGVSSEYNMRVCGTELILLVHRPWRNATSRQCQMSKVVRLLNYASTASEAARQDTLSELREAIEDLEIGNPGTQ